MILADPRISISYGEELGLLEGWRKDLDMGGRYKLGVDFVNAGVDLHMLCKP